MVVIAFCTQLRTYEAVVVFSIIWVQMLDHPKEIAERTALIHCGPPQSVVHQNDPIADTQDKGEGVKKAPIAWYW